MKSTCLEKLIIVWFMMCGVPSVVMGLQTVVLRADKNYEPLSKHLELLEDPKGEWRIEQISSETFSSKFQRSEKETPNFGFTQSVYWARIELANPFDSASTELLEMAYPPIDWIDLYIRQPDGTFIHKQSGDQFPFEKREVHHRNFLFYITIPPLQSQVLYIRHKTEGTMQFSLNLWTRHAFMEKATQELYVMGIYYGIMLIMIFYNSFVYFSVKDRSYLYYVLFITAFTVLQMALNGLAYQYLWPNLPWWGNRSIPFLMALNILVMIKFLHTFLHSKEITPRLHIVTYVLLGISIGVMLLSLFVSYTVTIRIGTLLVILGTLLGLTIATQAVRKHYRPAYFFLLAFFAVMVGAMILALKNFGVLPTSFLTEYGILIGSALQVLLLALGLADRINQMREQTMKAQQEALSAHEETARAQEEAIKLKDEFLATLEQKVRERTEQLQQKTNDINNMLQNMHQGIFTILEDGTIHPEYSIYLQEILETEQIAFVNALDLLFEKCDINIDVLDQVKVAILSTIGMDAFMFSMNSHILVKEIRKIRDDGRAKILELDWDPIVGMHGEIEKLMVTVRDVTELRQLQSEAEQHRKELDIIGQILLLSQKQFRMFLETSQEFFSENRKLIEESSDKDHEVIATLFRNMHTIKGNARTYGLTHVTEAVHVAEHSYDRLRKNEAELWNKTVLLEELSTAEKSMAAYHEVYREKLESFSGDSSKSSMVENALLDQLKNLVHRAHTEQLAPEQLTTSLDTFLNSIGTEKLEDILESILESLPKLAQELGKEIPKVTIQSSGIRLVHESIPMLKDVFMHMFRNSMDHGLETAEVRKSKGKLPQGMITLNLENLENRILFRMGDDGQGLNLDRLRKKAVETGLFSDISKISKEEAANLIFYSGLSTAESVSEISGRGVGMDAVKRFLQRQGGDITISLKEGPETGNPFELLITLPSKFGVSAMLS